MDNKDKLISGSQVASQVKQTLKDALAQLKKSGARMPGLATLLVGEDPGSQRYVAMKNKACEFVGIVPHPVTLPKTATQEEVCQKITDLNNNPDVDGILLQLPLPSHMETFLVTENIAPEKDSDGLTSHSAGLLVMGQETGFVPCTPKGMVHLIEKYGPVRGKHAVIVNHSPIVGRPLGQLLLNRGATITTCHIDTEDLAFHVRQADILISAVGKAHLVKADMVKPGAIVIDAGYSQVNGKITGDVDLEAVLPIASHITPPTGGVGPMTIAMLLQNTVIAYEKHTGKQIL